MKDESGLKRKKIQDRAVFDFRKNEFSQSLGGCSTTEEFVSRVNAKLDAMRLERYVKG